MTVQAWGSSSVGGLAGQSRVVLQPVRCALRTGCSEAWRRSPAPVDNRSDSPAPLRSITRPLRRRDTPAGCRVSAQTTWCHRQSVCRLAVGMFLPVPLPKRGQEWILPTPVYPVQFPPGNSHLRPGEWVPMSQTESVVVKPEPGLEVGPHPSSVGLKAVRAVSWHVDSAGRAGSPSGHTRSADFCRPRRGSTAANHSHRAGLILDMTRAAVEPLHAGPGGYKSRHAVVLLKPLQTFSHTCMTLIGVY